MAEWGHRWLLCGGMGSGKTTVRDLLQKAGIHTLDADSIGHRVLEPDGPAFDAVAERWPSVVKDGRIDRSLLAGIVFGDLDELQRLEAVTHPHIFGIITDQVEDLASPVVVEVPLLRHGLGDGWKRLVVDAPDEIRFDRAVSRGFTAEDVARRMEMQPDRGEWLAHADLVVPNRGGLDELAATVAAVLPLL